jgi:ribose-phosphate pyrophosphokinase
MIRSLNLDGMFVPSPLPEIEFKMMQFNGGEWNIKLNSNIDYSKVDKVVISHRIKDGNDIMKVLIAHDALKRKGIKSFDLIIPYIPYARQDRVCVEGESFTLKVFTDIINSMNFETVIVFDAHSDVAPALINNCENHSNATFIKEAIIDWGINTRTVNPEKNLLLVSPDSGANKKIKKLHSELPYPEMVIVKCDKKRELKSGALSGFEVFATDLEKKDCLIVDDIADGGATFIGIAEALKEKNAGDIYLFVTHGIFSKGFTHLLEPIKKIYTTNSFNDIVIRDFTKEQTETYVKQFKIQL